MFTMKSVSFSFICLLLFLLLLLLLLFFFVLFIWVYAEWICFVRNGMKRIHRATQILTVYCCSVSCVPLNAHTLVHITFWHVYTSLSVHTHTHVLTYLPFTCVRARSFKLVFKLVNNVNIVPMNVFNEFLHLVFQFDFNLWIFFVYYYGQFWVIFNERVIYLAFYSSFLDITKYAGSASKL